MIMQGNAVVFIVSIFVAAIVGIGASFAMQIALPETVKSSEGVEPDTRAIESLRGEIAATEHRINTQIEELIVSIETLGGQVSALHKEMQTRSVGVVQGSSAPGEAGTASPAVVSSGIDQAINRVLDDRDKRREEERQAEREQRATEMRERFKGFMTSRTDRYAEEKNWDAAKTEQIKQILSDTMDKLGTGGFGFGRGGRRGGPPNSEGMDQMRQTIEDARTKLLQLVTEEEATELLRSVTGMGGRNRGGRDRGGRDRGGNNQGGGDNQGGGTNRDGGGR